MPLANLNRRAPARFVKKRSGTRVLVLPEFATAFVGCFLAGGSSAGTLRDEGAAHCVEHLVFRGPRSGGLAEINRRFAAAGGALSAFTTKDFTAFAIESLPEHAGALADCLARILRDPALTPEALRAERPNILAEAAAIAQIPEELAVERLYAALFASHSLHSRPIIGSSAAVARLNAPALQSFYARNYTKRNLRVVVLGVPEPEALRIATALEHALSNAAARAQPPTPRAGACAQAAAKNVRLLAQPTSFRPQSAQLGWLLGSVSSEPFAPPSRVPFRATHPTLSLSPTAHPQFALLPSRHGSVALIAAPASHGPHAAHPDSAAEFRALTVAGRAALDEATFLQRKRAQLLERRLLAQHSAAFGLLAGERLATTGQPTTPAQFAAELDRFSFADALREFDAAFAPPRRYCR